MGILSYFLDLEANYLANSELLLTKSKYIKDLLVKVKMKYYNPCSIIIASNITLVAVCSDYL